MIYDRLEANDTILKDLRKDIVAVILNYFEMDKNFLEHKFKRDNDVSVLVFNTLILYVKRSRG